ncbi:hypothetical protein BJ166DRAFT_535357 [Pestalotiopsis sp. NC0098]|nr:hypothetical protein BJ166DRAFT_535357 [Pestalotiopsis sp. NC0098]
MYSLRFLLASAPLMSLAFAQDTTADDGSVTMTGDDSFMTMTDDGGDDGYPMTATYDTGVPASSYLDAFYGTAIPPKATGAAATSLAEALYSYEMALYTDDAYKSAANDVYMAAATQTNADDIFSSLDMAGVVNGGFTTASWYVDGVPESAKSEMASVLSGFNSVQTSALGVAAAATTTTGTGATTGASATGSGASATGTAKSTSASTAGAPRITGGAMAGLAAAVAYAVL